MAIGLIKCTIYFGGGGGGGGGGGTKSARIFCMGVHDILSVWGYQIS